MQLEQAINLIDHPSVKTECPATWADFGSGAGLFTNALATLLRTGSKIMAVDTNLRNFETIDPKSEVVIEKLQADFTSFLPQLINLTGILMANSLHFVSDKQGFLKRSFKYFERNETFLIVEYDMNQPNTWVPFPISFYSLHKLFTSMGFKRIEKIGEMRSRFNRSNIYSAVVMR